MSRLSVRFRRVAFLFSYDRHRRPTKLAKCGYGSTPFCFSMVQGSKPAINRVLTGNFGGCSVNRFGIAPAIQAQHPPRRLDCYLAFLAATLGRTALLFAIFKNFSIILVLGAGGFFVVSQFGSSGGLCPTFVEAVQAGPGYGVFSLATSIDPAR